MVFGQPRSLEKTQRYRLGFGLSHAFVNHQGLGNLLDDAQSFVKTGKRILIDHLCQRTLSTPLTRSRFWVEFTIKSYTSRSRTHQSQKKARQRGLATARLAHETEHFAALDREFNILEHVPRRLATEKAFSSVIAVLGDRGLNKRRIVLVIDFVGSFLHRKLTLSLLIFFDNLNDFLHFVEILHHGLIALLFLCLESFVKLGSVALCFHAARLPALFNGLHRGKRHATLHTRQWASTGKWAAVTELVGRRNFPLDRLQRPLFAFHVRHGVEQTFCVWVRRIG